MARNTIRWVAAGLHAPVLDDRAPMHLPADIHLERSPGTLDTLLADGAIDAVISPGAPRCFLERTAPVARLWRDPRAAATDYWRRTALFPIMHLLVVRRTLVEAHPDLADALFVAFEQARRLAAADLVARDFPKVALPWLGDHADATRATLGSDPWTYGLTANHSALKTMLRYAVADGLATPTLSPRSLFA